MSALPAVEHVWVEVRDHNKKLLFKYDPFRNMIFLQERRGAVSLLISLDHLRHKYGVLPDAPQDIVIGSETIMPEGPGEIDPDEDP